MMKRELSKLIAQKIIPVMILLFLVVNSFLFVMQSGEMKDISDCYSLPRSTLVEAGNTDYPMIPGFEVPVSYENEALKRIEQAEQYQNWRESYIGEMQIKISSGMFGEENSTFVKEMERAITIYDKLDGIEVQPVNQITAEAVLSFPVSFLIALLAGFSSAIILFFQERADGMHAMLKTMKGFRKLFIQKGCAVLFVTWFTFLLLVIAQWTIASVWLGVPHLFEPIQSVYGYHTVPFTLNVLSYSLLCYGWQLFLLLAVVFFIGLVVCSLDHYGTIALCIGIFVVLSWLAGSSTNIWIDSLSIFTLYDAPYFFSHDFILPLFGLLLPQHIFCLLYVILTGCMCGYGAYHFYCVKSFGAKEKNNGWMNRLRFAKSLASFERQRFWKHSVAAFVLVIATGIEIYRSLSFVYYPSAEMFAYQRYSEVLSGERSAEKEAYLKQEEERLIEVSSSGNPETVNETGLMRAKNQYEILTDDMPYVYLDGFSYWSGITAKEYRFLSSVIAVIASILVFSLYCAMEDETGMVMLENAYGKQKDICICKTRNVLFYSLLLTTGLFIPFVFRIHSIVPFDNLLYPACSLSSFSALPEWLPFLVIFIMQYLLLFTLICSVFFSISFMNRYVHKTGYLIICGSSFYFIVLIVWWLLMHLS